MITTIFIDGWSFATIASYKRLTKPITAARSSIIEINHDMFCLPVVLSAANE